MACWSSCSRCGRVLCCIVSSLRSATNFVRVQQVLACLRPWDGLSVQVQTQSSSDGEQQSFRRQLAEAVKGLETIEWLVPPMLQAR